MSHNKCTIEACEKVVSVGGLCNAHYKQKAALKIKESKQVFDGSITEQDLLEIAAVPSTDRLDKLRMHEAMRFIIAKNLKEGSYHITSDVMYFFYKNWSATPTGSRDFFLYFNKIYKPKRTNENVKFYLLEIDPFIGLLESGLALLKDMKVVLCEKNEESKKDNKENKKEGIVEGGEDES